MDHRKAYQSLVQFFGARNPKMTLQKRGFMDYLEGEINYKQEAG
jgi:hypothetical protein